MAESREQGGKSQRGLLGTNLEGVASWSSGWVFVDQFKKSRRWIAHTASTFDCGQAIAVDADGWPRAAPEGVTPGTLLMDSGAVCPAGRYTLRWRGEGVLTLMNVNAGQWRNPGVTAGDSHCEANDYELKFSSRGEGPHIVDIDYAGGVGGCRLVLSAINAQCHIRNIKLLMPGQSPSQRFHADWIATLQPYRTLRFMDWLNTNNSTITSWNQRALPRHANIDIAGAVPYEFIIELANLTGKDIWITIPHLADDDYVGHLAALLRTGLAPGVKCYVEYSNEVWNSLFQQAGCVEQAGCAAKLDANAYQARIKQYVQRAHAIFARFEQDFDADPQRLQKVLAWQAVDGANQDAVLACNKPLGKATILAIAPYFGSEYGDNPAAANWSVDQLLTELETVAVPAAVKAAHDSAARARAWGLQPACYEFGQHLVPGGPNANSDAVKELFIAANRDPRMQRIYSDYLRGLAASGCAPLLHFSDMGQPSVWGMWGAIETMDQLPSGTPKFRALQEFASAH